MKQFLAKLLLGDVVQSEAVTNVINVVKPIEGAVASFIKEHEMTMEDVKNSYHDMIDHLENVMIDQGKKAFNHRTVAANATAIAEAAEAEAAKAKEFMTKLKNAVENMVSPPPVEAPEPVAENHGAPVLATVADASIVTAADTVASVTAAPAVAPVAPVAAPVIAANEAPVVGGASATAGAAVVNG